MESGSTPHPVRCSPPQAAPRQHRGVAPAPSTADTPRLEEYLTAYLDGAGLRGDPKGPLFRTIGRDTGQLTRRVLPQANAYAMIRRRAAAAGIATKLGNHNFRATGITAYLMNGDTLEKSAAMQTTPPRARRSSTIAGATSSASIRSTGL